MIALASRDRAITVTGARGVPLVKLSLQLDSSWSAHRVRVPLGYRPSELGEVNNGAAVAGDGSSDRLAR